MNRFTLFLFFALIATVSIRAQNLKKVSASYTYYAPETMSVEEAKRTALDRAKIQAIADEFGSLVTQSTSTVISNKNGESDTQFFSIGGSDVKGEWIETIGEPTFDIKFEEHYLIVNCSVRGIVRDINNERIEISAKLLRNGTNPKYESSEFKSGDDMYLWIQSPSNGFLLVFWIDYTEGKAYRILPYQGDNSTLMPVSKDRQYVFFSQSEADDIYSSIVDEFVMVCDSEVERNEVYILFSDKKFSVNNIDGLSEGIKWLSIDNFHKWLAKIKKNLPNITINKFNLLIKQS